jgi:hypothetical protein
MTSTSANMDVDKPQGGHSTTHGKAVPINPGGGTVSPCVFAVTPINPNTKTSRGMQIANEIRARSLGLLASVGGASPQTSSEPTLHAVRGADAWRLSSPVSMPVYHPAGTCVAMFAAPWAPSV